jgi:hypothetical protein
MTAGQAAAADRSWYGRALRLRHLRLSTWQRAILAEGSVVVAFVLVLGDLASAWLLLVLPLSVAAVVKAHDLLSGALATQRTGNAESAGPRGEPAPSGVVRGA